METTVPVCEETSAFVDAVRQGLRLNPRQLPSRFLYDTLGSALFDTICHLPWYHVTRAELGLIRRHATAVGRVFQAGGRVVELGCGNGEKLATLLACAHARDLDAHVIDVSEAALAQSLRTFATLARSAIRVITHHAAYEDGLRRIAVEGGGSTLVAMFGSSIGNFDVPHAAAFLARIRAALQPCDHLLLGADLVKPERDLLLAYDDPLGITAAFNKNLLVRLNRELGANFTIERFAHRAVWNRDASRVEMHLVSVCPQDVDVAGAHLRLRLMEGETIWTESSYKFTPDGIRRLVEPTGFVQRSQWIDESARFALTLFDAV